MDSLLALLLTVCESASCTIHTHSLEPFVVDVAVGSIRVKQLSGQQVLPHTIYRVTDDGTESRDFPVNPGIMGNPNWWELPTGGASD